MTLTPYLHELIAGGFALLGTLIGALLNHYFSNYRSSRGRFNIAADNFRAAFDDVLVLLSKNFREDSQTMMIDKIITPEVLERQDKARIQFEPFLDKSSLKGFNDAWDTYEKFKENYNINKPDDLSIRYISFKMIDHINELLNYAKPKF